MPGKKRAAPPAARHRLSLGLRLMLSLTVFLCVLVLLRIRPRAPGVSSEDSGLNAKIAFLFLARSNLPLDFVWHTFFQNTVEKSYSIYIHSEPGFVFDPSTTRSPFFYHRQLKRSVKVSWGESTMIEAERLLLAAALNDPANKRFVLLSDSCVPLYNFTYIYSYLISSSKSFVDSFLDKKEGRYNPEMSPAIPKTKWRKGSQWVALVRKHAEVVVADKFVFPIFKRYCKKAAVALGHDCIPDEHYMQTLFSINELEDELEKRTLTYTSWNQSSDHMDKKTWHPRTFEYADATPQHINEIKSINHVNYEKEHRTEWCRCNSTSVPCFLFARKFSGSAAMRLLREQVAGPFDAVATLLVRPS